MPQRPRAILENDRLYFAYGSNLHLAHMAKRCPSSIFLGKATLAGHGWFINERGVANVAESPYDFVEGLLYALTPADEKTLDRSEGVAKDLYQKRLVDVQFAPVTGEQLCRCSSVDLAKRLDAARASSRKGTTEGGVTMMLSNERGRVVARTVARLANFQSPASPQANSRLYTVSALVYIGLNYTKTGRIREEYVPRMERAMEDALALGVSETFISTYMMPSVYKATKLTPPRSGPSRSSRRPSTAHQEVPKEARTLLHTFPEPGRKSANSANTRSKSACPVVRRSVEPRKLSVPEWPARGHRDATRTGRVRSKSLQPTARSQEKPKKTLDLGRTGRDKKYLHRSTSLEAAAEHLMIDTPVPGVRGPSSRVMKIQQDINGPRS